MKNPKMKDRATKDAFIEMRAGGISFAAIAKKLHVGKRTLVEWSKECKEEIEKLRAIEDEALREQHRATVAAWLEILGGLEERIVTELKKRKLESVSTKDLADLLFKCDGVLAGLVAPVRFKKTFSYNFGDLVLDNQTATTEWEG
jgi:transposase